MKDNKYTYFYSELQNDTFTNSTCEDNGVKLFFRYDIKNHPINHNLINDYSIQCDEDRFNEVLSEGKYYNMTFQNLKEPNIITTSEILNCTIDQPSAPISHLFNRTYDTASIDYMCENSGHRLSINNIHGNSASTFINASMYLYYPIMSIALPIINYSVDSICDFIINKFFTS